MTVQSTRSWGHPGFTLVELLIVMVVVAILAVVAYPSYVEQVRKTARKEAIGKLLEVASRVEQYRTQKLAYPAGDDLQDFKVEGDKYDITVEASTNGVVVKATPVAGTSQAADKCGVLSWETPGIWGFSGEGVAEKDCI